jgi:Tol biopolymer transport system component
MDSDGGNQRQFTFDASLEDGAMVSRDGRSVVFGVPSQGIWRIDLDGGNRKQLTTRGMFPEFSPDGKWVFYTLPREQWSMWKVPAEGGEPVRVTDWPAAQPVVSPDGKLMAYVFSTSYTEHKLYVTPVEGGDPVKIFDWGPDNMYDLEWTPDGKAIVYAANENGVKEFFSQPLDGGGPRIFLAAKGEFENLGNTTFSRDGKQLFVSSGPTTKDVVMFSLER